MILSEITLIIKPINNNATQYAQKKQKTGCRRKDDELVDKQVETLPTKAQKIGQKTMYCQRHVKNIRQSNMYIQLKTQKER